MAKTSREPWISLTLGQQFLIGSAVILTVLTFSILLILEMASSPYAQASGRAENLARQAVQLETIETINSYRGVDDFHTVLGTDSDGQELAILVSDQTSQVYVYKLSDGVAQAQAETIAQEQGAGQIDRSIIGMREGKPIWEIKSGTAYYNIDFKTGDFIKKEGL
ncbi:peptidase [Streptococcus suis]|uniref:Peptidase n=1 Tax=Streptococcus suis TaxID=1307 RepID=A0A3R8REK5_STRSU|nr:peptidase [Streptococcus suis]